MSLAAGTESMEAQFLSSLHRLARFDSAAMGASKSCPDPSDV